MASPVRWVVRLVVVAGWLGGLAAGVGAQRTADNAAERGGGVGSGARSAGARPDGPVSYRPARQAATPAVTYGDIQVSSFGTRVLPASPQASQVGRRHERGGDGGLGLVDLGTVYVTGLPAASILNGPEIAVIPDGNVASESAQSSDETQRLSAATSSNVDGRYAVPQAAPVDIPQGNADYAAPIVRAEPPAYEQTRRAPPRVVTPAASAAPPEEAEAVTLVFKDGRPTEKVRNYMITRTTLYITDKRRREIPIEALDVPATEKANRDAGLSFSLPAAK